MAKTNEQAPASSQSSVSANDELDVTTTARIDPTEMDAIAIGALDGPDESAEGGQRVRRVITTKDFIPNRDPEWIRLNVSSQPKGTYTRLGLIAGFITGCHRQRNEYQGKTLESVWLEGMFEGTVLTTGEVIQAPTLILPLAYGELVESAFRQAFNAGHERMQAELDVELGLETITRGAVSYEWVVTSFVTGEAQRALRAVRKRQQARLAKQTTPALAAPQANLKAISSR